MDGYDAAGERVYDRVNGKTCHQCRQKTIGKRTRCGHCESADVRPDRGNLLLSRAPLLPGLSPQQHELGVHLRAFRNAQMRSRLILSPL